MDEKERKARRSLLFKIIFVLILLLAYFLYKEGLIPGLDYSPNVISEKEFLQKEARKDDTKGQVYILESENYIKDAIIVLKGQQFTKEHAKFWLNIKNNSPKDLHILSTTQSTLLVREGDVSKQYNVDAFANKNPSIVSGNSEADIVLTFEPIPKSAKELEIRIPNVFRMNNESAFNVTLEFAAP